MPLVYTRLNVGETKLYSGREGGNCLSVRNPNNIGQGQVTIPMDNIPAHDEVLHVPAGATQIGHMNDDREGEIINTGNVMMEFAVQG